MRVWYTLGHLTALKEVKENKLQEMDTFDSIRYDEEMNEIVLSKGAVSSVLIPCDVATYDMLLSKIKGTAVEEIEIKNSLGYILFDEADDISSIREEIRKYNTITHHMEVNVFA